MGRADARPQQAGARSERDGHVEDPGVRDLAEEVRSRPVSRVLSKLALRDSHSSGTAVTRSLKQPTREQRGPRYRSPIWSCTGWGLPCRPCCHVRGGLLPATRYVAPPPRCCRETPFHPCLIPFGPSAVCSLLHFPSDHSALALPGSLPCGVRTFLCPCEQRRPDPRVQASRFGQRPMGCRLVESAGHTQPRQDVTRHWRHRCVGGLDLECSAQHWPVD